MGSITKKLKKVLKQKKQWKCEEERDVKIETDSKMKWIKQKEEKKASIRQIHLASLSRLSCPS